VDGIFKVGEGPTKGHQIKREWGLISPILMFKRQKVVEGQVIKMYKTGVDNCRAD